MSTIIEKTAVGEGVPHLPRYVRFRDLRISGIADNWPQLLRLIEQHGFPSGRLLSPNVRAWTIDEVEAWVATRPIARKAVQPRKQRETEAAQ